LAAENGKKNLQTINFKPTVGFADCQRSYGATMAPLECFPNKIWIGIEQLAMASINVIHGFTKRNKANLQ